MAYTPPAYNAVVFNFTIPGYVPAAYNRVIFNFGAIPTPPLGSALITRQAAYSERADDDVLMVVRRFAPVITTQSLVPSRAPQRWLEEEPEDRVSQYWSRRNTFIVRSLLVTYTIVA